MPEEKKYTAEDIEKMAPHYKGKPENFDPAKVGQGKKKSQNSAKSATVQTQ